MINIRKVRVDRDGNETKEFAQDKKIKFCPDGCKTIVDTGTYLIYGPGEKIMKLLEGIELYSCEDKSTLPDIAFEF